jgi:rare lipoprotein A
MFRTAALSVALAALLLSGCAHKRRAKIAPPRAPRNTAPAVIGKVETGMASWYGHPYHGRQAADGETYDMETLVAAHRTLPFQTWVRVFNLQNNKSIDVRIIDRGPFINGRIIDLSHAAAQAIDMIGPGVAKVRVEVIRAPQTITVGLFAVQVGAYLDREKADGERAAMKSRYGSARVILEKGYWRVVVGSETSEDAASLLAQRIRHDFPEKNNAFVVRVDVGST